MNRNISLLGYGAVALVSFVIFFMTLFPYEQLNSRLVGEIEQSLGGEFHVKIGRIRARPLAHVTARDIEILKGEAGLTSLIKIDKIGIGVSLLSTLFGSPKFGFDIRQGEGELEGDFKSGSEAWRVEADLDDWNIGNMPFMKQEVGLELSSRVDGDVDLELFKADPIRHQGVLRLKVKELKVLPSKFHVGDPGQGLEIDLPELELAKKHDSGMEFQVGKGKVEIKKFALTGDDLNLTAEGELFIARDLRDWRLDIKGKFKPSEKMATAAQVLFIVDKQKDADGYYPFAISGRFARPSVRIGTFRVPL